MGEAVVVEAAEVGAGRMADVGAGFGAHLPAAIHPADAEAGIAAAVSQADFQVGAFIKHAAIDERGEGDGAVDGVADGVGEMPAVGAGFHYRGVALVDEEERAQLLGGLPEGEKSGVVIGLGVDLVVNHRANHSQLLDGALEFGNGGRKVLHRQGGQAAEAVGMVKGELMHFVVALPGDGGGDGRLPVVQVKGGAGGNHLDVDAEGVHIGDALLRRPHFHRVDVGFGAGGGEAVPGLAGGDGALKALGFVVGVEVNGPHMVDGLQWGFSWGGLGCKDSG